MNGPRIGQHIRERMAAIGMEIKVLAAIIGKSERTITRARQGHVSRHTLDRIFEELGPPEGEARHAPEDHGGYSEKDYNHYLGHYLSYRRSFISREAIVVSHMAINWPPDKTCLCFQLCRIQDNPTSKKPERIYREGEIYITKELGFVHFVSYSHGEVRLITTCKFREKGNKTLTGMVLTLTESDVPVYPAASHIILQKQETTMIEEEIESHIGVFPCNHELVAEMTERLIETERFFARR